MRIIFLGSSQFSYPSLEILMKSRYEIAGVITQPGRPFGRGQKIRSASVKDLAESSRVPIAQPEKASSIECRELVQEIHPDIIVVVAYGQILSKEFLAIPKYGCVNVHSSLLPKFRGASPINWAIIKGEKKTGVTTIQMDEGMDTGDILLQKETPILADEDAESLSKRLAKLAAEILMETLSLYEEGKAFGTKQQSELSSYTRLLKKEDGQLDWNWKAEQIINLIRGLTPWPGVFSFLEGQRIKLIRGYPIEEKCSDLSPGVILRANVKEGLVVTAGENSLLGITSLQPENKRVMNSADFIQGYRKKLEGMTWSFSEKEYPF